MWGALKWIGYLLVSLGVLFLLVLLGGIALFLLAVISALTVLSLATWVGAAFLKLAVESKSNNQNKRIK